MDQENEPQAKPHPEAAWPPPTPESTWWGDHGAGWGPPAIPPTPPGPTPYRTLRALAAVAIVVGAAAVGGVIGHSAWRTQSSSSSAQGIPGGPSFGQSP